MDRKLLTVVAVSILALAAGAPFLSAQAGPPPGPPLGPPRFRGPGPQDGIGFLGFQMGPRGKTVTGAPYSAQVTSEFMQTLRDGNTIDRKNTSTFYRDSQGRTRREETLPAIGPYSASGTPPQVIFINDPVAGVSYVLEPLHKTARKMVMPPPRNPGNIAQGLPPRGNRDPNTANESFYGGNIEGLPTQGTRITRTIPAGGVGNQQALKTVSEHWYSPDLSLDLQVKNTDPMRGTSTTTFSNLRRDPPDASLFEVPSDYTVQDAGRGPRGMRMPPGPGAPKQ
jgi:hypothetical protein